MSSVRRFRVVLVMIGCALLACAADARQTSPQQPPPSQQTAPPAPQTAPPAPQTAPPPTQAPPTTPAGVPAQSAPPATQPAAGSGAPERAVPTTGIEPPPGYIIGARDVLSVVFWRDKDMSSDVAVRPDGKISLPLINEIEAAGLTPDQLRDRITQAAARYVADPTVSVVVREINSRQVYITGEVNRPGAYALMTPTTVMQLISLAGGLREYAKTKEIVILRNEAGKQSAIQFNYRDVVARRKLNQNILLRPGDTVVVP